MILHRAYRFRLYPTPDQEAVLRQFVGATRFVYNLALEQRRDWWRQFTATTGRKINWASQSPEVSLLRREVEWLAAVPRVCLEQALRDLEGAYGRFFRGEAGYPSPRRRGENDSFRLQRNDTAVSLKNAKWGTAHVPKLGAVAFRLSRPILGDMRNATVSLRAGQWWIAFTTERDVVAEGCSSNVVGIDRGVANTLACSDGALLSLPSRMAEIERQRRHAQRVASRKQRGSKRHGKAVQRRRSLDARLARVRADWHHRTSSSLARRFGVVALEKLRVANMTRSAAGTLEAPGRNVAQKRGLNRSILNQGWHAFANMLAYKLEERGGRLIYVDPAYTSQTCSDCGTIDSGSRESQASFCCRHCGHRAHADVNAAINILRRSTASMRVEEAGCGSVETRTTAMSDHRKTLAA